MRQEEWTETWTRHFVFVLSFSNLRGRFSLVFQHQIIDLIESEVDDNAFIQQMNYFLPRSHVEHDMKGRISPAFMQKILY